MEKQNNNKKIKIKKGKNQMIVTNKNEKSRTMVVSNVTPSGLDMQFAIPFKGDKKAQRLVVRQGKSRVNLTGGQVNALLRVIRKGKKLA